MFVSISFLVFLGIVVACYFCVHSKWRTGLLLIASYIFCGFLSLRALIVLFAISGITYLFGIALEKAIGLEDKRGKTPEILLALSVGSNLLILLGYKYFSYMVRLLGITEIFPQKLLEELIMPIGLSFYLFQAISYLADIYKKKCKAEKNFICLGLYFAFFAKFISGPIERKNDFVSQLENLEKVRFLERGRLSTAFTYMLWGYFMKMVVADRLAVIVTKIFAAPDSFDSLWLFFGALFYTVQIYCDFAGYSYIAVGCARIFGITLTNNFKAPYMAENITDFWRRWHISLSRWLRDYLYIPLGGSRKGRMRKYINTMIVFLFCGIWHGTGMNYIMWGMLHGLYLIINSMRHTWKEKRPPAFAQWRRLGSGVKVTLDRMITFLTVMFAWIFFRASGLKSAFLYVRELFTSGIRLGQYELWMQQTDITVMELGISLTGIIIIGIADWLCYRTNEEFPEWIQHGGNVVRYAVFYVLILVIWIFGIYGPGYRTEDFIYMQF